MYMLVCIAGQWHAGSTRGPCITWLFPPTPSPPRRQSCSPLTPLVSTRGPCIEFSTFMRDIFCSSEIKWEIYPCPLLSLAFLGTSFLAKSHVWWQCQTELIRTGTLSSLLVCFNLVLSGKHHMASCTKCHWVRKFVVH